MAEVREQDLPADELGVVSSAGLLGHQSPFCSTCFLDHLKGNRHLADTSLHLSVRDLLWHKQLTLAVLRHHLHLLDARSSPWLGCRHVRAAAVFSSFRLLDLFVRARVFIAKQTDSSTVVVEGLGKSLAALWTLKFVREPG